MRPLVHECVSHVINHGEAGVRVVLDQVDCVRVSDDGVASSGHDQSRWHGEVRSDVHLPAGKDARERRLVDEHRARRDLLAIAASRRRRADNEMLVEPFPCPESSSS